MDGHRWESGELHYPVQIMFRLIKWYTFWKWTKCLTLKVNLLAFPRLLTATHGLDLEMKFHLFHRIQMEDVNY